MMARSSRFRVAIMALVTMMLVVACGGQPAAPTTPATSAPAAPAPTAAAEAPAAEEPAAEAPAAEPVAASNLPADAAPADQQVLNVSGIEGKHFDLNRNTYEFNDMGHAAWEPLVYIGGDLQVRPAAADSWETSEDGLTWTFHLRENAKWSDGQPVTAEDWEYSYRRMLSLETANPYSWFYKSIKNAAGWSDGSITDPEELGVKAVDTYTLQFTTEAPTPYFLNIVGFVASAPVAKHVAEANPDWANSVETAVSNGFMKYETWNKGQNLVLVKNPYYEGPNKAKLEKIVIHFVPQGTTPPTLQMFQAGEIDWAMLDAAMLPQAIANPAFQGQLDVFANYVTYYMYFNTDQAPFNDLRVRQAFSMAVDREAIANNVMQGLDLPGYTHLPPGFPCSQSADPEIKAIQAFNVEKARELLAEAGYPNGEGFPKQELWVRQGQVAKEGEAIQRMLKENLGVEVELRDVERAVYMEKMTAKEINLGLIQWYYDFIDPSNFMDWWVTGARHTWQNEEFNELVTAASSELDPEARCGMYNQAERILIEDVGGAFIAHPSAGELWSNKVGGVQLNPDGFRVHYPAMYADIYIKQ
jgi:ABC-type oligopeptide transport system substrate-binding subunit